MVLPAGTVTVPTPFPSPEDWRVQWIYFLMVDRFSNSQSPPLSMTLHPPIAWDAPFGEFQSGTFAGIIAQLDYLKQLGAGALWLTPVTKNCQYEAGTFHGYGIQDFLTVEPRFGTTPATAAVRTGLKMIQASAGGTRPMPPIPVTLRSRYSACLWVQCPQNTAKQVHKGKGIVKQSAYLQCDDKSNRIKDRRPTGGEGDWVSTDGRSDRG